MCCDKGQIWGLSYAKKLAQAFYEETGIHVGVIKVSKAHHDFKPLEAIKYHTHIIYRTDEVL